jgi:hypothetical protein
MPPIHIRGSRPTRLHNLFHIPLILVPNTTYPSTYYTIYTTIGYGCCQPAHGMPPIHGAHGVPPIHGAHGMPPIHIHGSRPTRLHHLFHIPLILVPTTQYIPLLAMATVGPPVSSGKTPGLYSTL